METESSLEERYYSLLRKASKTKNGCGFYQVFVVLFVWLGMLSAGIVTSGFTFWLLRAPCDDTACTELEKCDGEARIKNWVTQLGI